MNEWQKIALSALAGLLAGLALEPVKYSMLKRLKRREVRRVLYSNIVEILNLICMFIGLEQSESLKAPSERWPPEAWFHWNVTEIFDHYYAHERVVLFELPEVYAITTFYNELKTLLAAESNKAYLSSQSEAERLEIAEKMIEHLNIGMGKKTIGYRLLLSVAKAKDRQTVVDFLTGARAADSSGRG